MQPGAQYLILSPASRDCGSSREGQRTGRGTLCSGVQRPAGITSLIPIAKYWTGSNSVEEGIILAFGLRG